jgi:LCP family protein required for cell wall assembly
VPARRTRSPRLRWPQRISGALVAGAAVAALLGTAGTLHLSSTLDAVERVDTGDALRSDEDFDDSVQNFLLVGSDTREGADPTAIDFGSMGDEGEVGGRRSDTMMVLRLDPKTGESAVLSLPRDLWVDVAGADRQDRLNGAYAKSIETLIETVTTELGIPIDHYVEVDFVGFKDLVDAVGGIDVWFDLPTRDRNTGLRIETPGCHRLDGVQALAYVRARHFQQRLNGDWIDDESADLGRMSRQRDFLQRAVDAAVEKAAGDPTSIGKLVGIAVDTLRVDEGLDLPALAERLSRVAGGDIQSYALPVEDAEIDGNRVLLLDEEEAFLLLSYFRGEPPPAVVDPSAPAQTQPVASSAAPQTAAPTPPPTGEAVGIVPDADRPCG